MEDIELAREAIANCDRIASIIGSGINGNNTESVHKLLGDFQGNRFYYWKWN